MDNNTVREISGDTIRPIAFFRSPFPTKFGVPRQSGVVSDLAGIIEFVPEFRRDEAVRGLEGYDYLWLIWGFSGNAGKWGMTVRPPRLGGNSSVGVFASRSPFRPNGLGLSSVRIDSVRTGLPSGPEIRVLGADLMDGTPIYDIKPYVAYTDSHPGARSGFTDEVDWPEAEVVFPEELRNRFMDICGGPNPGIVADSLERCLAQRPVPRYQNDSTRIYCMPFLSCDVRFRVEGERVIVVDIVRN